MVRSYREERERQETAIDGIEGGDLEYWKQNNRLITFKDYLIGQKGERDAYERTQHEYNKPDQCGSERHSENTDRFILLRPRFGGVGNGNGESSISVKSNFRHDSGSYSWETEPAVVRSKTSG